MKYVDTFPLWLAQMRKGLVELFVLRLLHERGASHGYAVVRDLKELGSVVAGESTVYPVLKRLESDGLVQATWSNEPFEKPRKYYRITAAGCEFLERASGEWDGIVRAMTELRGEGDTDDA